MKTVLQLLEENLTEDVLEKALANIKISKGVRYDIYLGMSSNSFFDALNGAFVFSQTKEGHKFWRDILNSHGQFLFDPIDPFIYPI